MVQGGDLYNLLLCFRNLSDQGKTIVCTIHQPSSQVFAMFDRILLMAEGRVAFLGNTNDAVDFFQNINRPCPYNFNPADHYIHVLAVRPGNEAQCREEINSICDSFAVTDAGRMVRFFRIDLVYIFLRMKPIIGCFLKNYNSS